MESIMLIIKNRKLLIAFLTVIVVASLAFTVWPGEKEPEYQGNKLSEWLYLADSKAYAYVRPDNEPVQALRAIGTNAIPFLLKWVATENTPRLMTLSIQVRRLPKFPSRDAIVNWLGKRAYSPISTRMRGLSGFQILG